MTPAVPNPERSRQLVGAVVYALLTLVGAAILVDYFLLPPLATRNPGIRYEAMMVGALLAFPPLVVYLWIPWFIDRFDPEPWWCLALALAWGAIAACGFAALINTNVEDLVVYVAGGPRDRDALALGEAIGSCVSAPLVEEFWKGLAVFGAFYFLRREFDGVVDGIIYATFAALGFAAVENVIYYSRAHLDDVMRHGDVLAGTFVMRGILSPWGHPLYTSMTGIGFGIARESEKAWLRWLAPIGGYFAAAFLHFVWNGAATLSGAVTLVMLPLWFLFVAGFLGMLVWLVVRKGRIIRDHLRDEVLMGNLAQVEVDLICSPFGRLKATFSNGGLVGRQFVAAGARLGLCKWHAARAMRGQKRTVSMDFIVPLRRELADLRARMYQGTGRPMPVAQAWQPPPAAPPPPVQPQYQQPQSQQPQYQQAQYQQQPYQQQYQQQQVPQQQVPQPPPGWGGQGWRGPQR